MKGRGGGFLDEPQQVMHRARASLDRNWVALSGRRVRPRARPLRAPPSLGRGDGRKPPKPADVGIAVLGLIGFTLLWRGRWELGPENAAWSGLTQLALLVAVVAYAAYPLAGVFLGFVPGAAFLAPWRSLLLFVGALFVGAALYWTLSHLPATGVAPAAAVAFALGVAGSALLLVGTPGLRRGEALGVHGAGLGLSLASSILWLVLCVWGSQRLRERTAPSPSPGTVHGG